MDNTTISAHDRYLFDLQGFLVVPDALTPQHCAELDAEMTRRLASEADPGTAKHRFEANGPLLAWGPAWTSLLDNPRIMPYLREFIGDEIRLDHEYAEAIRPGRGPLGSTLHGGAAPFDECFFYLFKDGRIRSALTVVAYALRDVHPGDGGFGCIPGSHKSNYPIPPGWHNLDNPAPCISAVSIKAGSAVIFTEALAHGTLPWRGTDERRTVFYKYSPRTISWSSRRYDASLYPDLTPVQAALLEGPNARYPWR